MIESTQQSSNLAEMQTAARVSGESYIASPIRTATALPEVWVRVTSNTFVFTLAACAIPLFYFLFHFVKSQMSSPLRQFRFMELPPELRDMVYENLLEDPVYPVPPPCTKHRGNFLNYLPPNWRTPSPSRQEKKKSNLVFLANKQIYAEFMNILVKKATFHLTISPANYSKRPLLSNATNPQIQDQTPTTAPSQPPAPLAVTALHIQSANTPKARIWTISPETLKNVRKCDIKLITTSAMFGVSDPRTMAPASWDLALQIQQELSEVKHIKEPNLHVRAIGDPLWNPLWVWYHATQSFIAMGSTSPTSPSTSSATIPSPPLPGPSFSKISFSLDTWSPGENHLELSSRTADAKWGWYCMEGHCVGADASADMTVREFCARLYTECRVCRPELESEDEDEDGGEVWA